MHERGSDKRTSGLEGEKTCQVSAKMAPQGRAMFTLFQPELSEGVGLHRGEVSVSVSAAGLSSCGGQGLYLLLSSR